MCLCKYKKYQSFNTAVPVFYPFWGPHIVRAPRFPPQANFLVLTRQMGAKTSPSSILMCQFGPSQKVNRAICEPLWDDVTNWAVQMCRTMSRYRNCKVIKDISDPAHLTCNIDLAEMAFSARKAQNCKSYLRSLRAMPLRFKPVDAPVRDTFVGLPGIVKSMSAISFSGPRATYWSGTGGTNCWRAAQADSQDRRSRPIFKTAVTISSHELRT